MTVKNGAPWVSDAIKSILSQTFPLWEFIIVDDGSNDDTPRILQSFARLDSRIRVIFTEGIGRGPALNLALKHARAPYVANIDADDLSHPQRLEIELNAFQKNPSFALIATDGIVFSEQQEIHWLSFHENKFQVFDITDQLMLFNPVLHSSVMIAREAVLAVGGYNEKLKNNLDYDLWVRLATVGFRLGLLNLRLIGKRIHSHQSFETSQHLRYVLSGIRIQHQAIRNHQTPKRLKLKAWLFLFLRIGWGLLPKRIRLLFAKRRQQFSISAHQANYSA